VGRCAWILVLTNIFVLPIVSHVGQVKIDLEKPPSNLMAIVVPECHLEGTLTRQKILGEKRVCTGRL
jgi:hypothetical protein